MEWIRIEDDLPWPNEIVLVFDEISGVISLAKFIEVDDPSNFDNDDIFEVMHINPIEIDYYVTHWMTLPDKPKD